MKLRIWTVQSEHGRDLVNEQLLGGESLANVSRLCPGPGNVHVGEGGQGGGDLVANIVVRMVPVLPQDVVCPAVELLHPPVHAQTLTNKQQQIAALFKQPLK